jgi:molybdopterin-guanine dinucleotide biosynthesis protein A
MRLAWPGSPAPMDGWSHSGRSNWLRAAYLAKTEDLSMYLRQIESTETEFPVIDGLDPFFNINTPGDLKQAERLIAAIHRPGVS